MGLEVKGVGPIETPRHKDTVYLPRTTVPPTVVAVRHKRAETAARAQFPDSTVTRAVTNECRYFPSCISSPPKRSLQARGRDRSALIAPHMPRGARAAVTGRALWLRPPGSPVGPSMQARRPGARLRRLTPARRQARRPRARANIPSAAAVVCIADPRRPSRPQCSTGGAFVADKVA